MVALTRRGPVTMGARIGVMRDGVTCVHFEFAQDRRAASRKMAEQQLKEHEKVLLKVAADADTEELTQRLLKALTKKVSEQAYLWRWPGTIRDQDTRSSNG